MHNQTYDADESEEYWKLIIMCNFTGIFTSIFHISGPQGVVALRLDSEDVKKQCEETHLKYGHKLDWKFRLIKYRFINLESALRWLN